MRVLVAYGSKMGGTQGLAEVIGEELRSAGHDVVVLPAAAAPDPAGFDAVIVGGALYAARWHRDARRYVKRRAKALRERPVWLFSSGPLDDSATAGEIPPTKQVDDLMGRIRARGHITFGGRLPADAKGFVAGSMAKKNAGDWRDMDQVRAWAREVGHSIESVQA